jgi:hypothetical protein
MPDVYPPYIFGMHDRGGEHLMLQKDKRGWVLVTEGVKADPDNRDGSNYTDLSILGLGVIVRLNYGYGTEGNIPHSSQYDNFARRCGNFVEASPGCNIWIIGNEMNLANERPGGPGGQVITPQLYASCFQKCRTEIRSRSGHEADQVVVGAVGPYNIQTTYPGNDTGDFAGYLADILKLLGEDVDGIALHAYTHGQNPDLVSSDAKMLDSRVKHLHNEFRVYRDFMNVIPQNLRNRPVYITETDQYGAWRDQNSGWVRNAYKEIDDWNQTAGNQPIQALILYRWIIGNASDPREVGWAITNKPGVQDDFRAAMNNQYQVILPQIQLDYLAGWLQVTIPGRMDRDAPVTFSVSVRNDGRMTWYKSGTSPVWLGYRWIDSTGTAGQWFLTPLPSTAAPGQTVALPAVTVTAPGEPGLYTLEVDLVQGESGWFAAEGSPTWRQEVRVGDRYRVAWLSVAAPPEGTAGETITIPLRVRNDGSLTWPPDGDHPVHLTYKWLDANRNVVVADGLRTPLGRQVAPLEEISLNATVQFPPNGGQYILQMDMVQEFVAWFQGKGSPVYEAQVQVAAAVLDYAAQWLAYEGPERLLAGEEGSALVQVKNIGAQPWFKSGANPVQLGYRWLDAQGNQAPVAGIKAQALTATIQPGETATFRDVPLAAPETPGTYRLVLDLMQGGKWLSAQGVAVMERPLQITAAPYGVEWQVLKPWPAWMAPNAEMHTSFRLRNTGTVLWAAAGDHPVRLAYEWFTQDGKLTEPWDTFRSPLPGNVPSGQSVDLSDVAFKTPRVVGNYILRWDLVEEGKAWFFRQGGAPLEVQVEVSDRPIFAPWTAQASHNAADVGLAFDGDPDTAWDSGADQKPGMWFQVDLGEVLVLDRVTVASPGRGFPVGYQVKLSEDGQDWHLVAEQPKNWRDIDDAFAPCKARFLRIEQTGTPQWTATWKISEIAVSTTELWAGATASHYAGDAGQAIDARLRTAWNTRSVKQKPGMWFQVDLGSVREIQRVVLEHPTNQQPRGYLVRVSTDQQAWQEVGRKDDNWGAVDVEFQPAAARYVYVETTNSSNYHPWGIAEFIVWRSSPLWVRGRAS